MGSEIQCQPEVVQATPIAERGRDHDWTDEEKVEFLADRAWSMARICRKTGLSKRRVEAIIDEVDERRVEEIRRRPELRKARYVALNRAIEEESWRSYRRKGCIRDLKVGLEAREQTIKILGDRAPTRTVNEEWKVHALVNPEVHARIMADPDAREALIRLEEFAAGHQADFDVTPPEGGGG